MPLCYSPCNLSEIDLNFRNVLREVSRTRDFEKMKDFLKNNVIDLLDARMVLEYSIKRGLIQNIELLRGK